jgi:hypothetical protein
MTPFDSHFHALLKQRVEELRQRNIEGMAGAPDYAAVRLLVGKNQSLDEVLNACEEVERQLNER